uniref:Integrase, catalytic region, zinc finger, CCHC-type, peptidase aspartic, catalytic n=1 Tax=Tanacetum cinerariifolium TaxID=118510 RepID=A0A6L2MJM8_TANCI|nr:hypothetical protein [Tanacetum cinerariifolium]
MRGVIVDGAENHPLMLENLKYGSWESHICLFIKGKKYGSMMLDSIDNGPLIYPTVEENRLNRPKKYFELTKAQPLQDECDVQETNIILHVLPPDVYALVNHQEAAKDTWDRVKLLMKATELSYQEFLHNLAFQTEDFDAYDSYCDDISLAKAVLMENLSSCDPDVPSRKHYCQIFQAVKHMLRGRLLASFQDHKHEGGVTRSQDGIKDNDIKIQIQDHSMHMITQRNSQDHKAPIFKKVTFE